MNDDFERKLQDQPLRRVPAEWRMEILRAAGPVERKTALEPSMPLWQLIFGRFPIASAAFAGFWILLIAVNALLFSGTGGSSGSQPIARNTEPSSIWRLQNEELQQIASGDSDLAPQSALPAPATLPHGPRSDLRREDEGVGEIRFDVSLNFTA